MSRLRARADRRQLHSSRDRRIILILLFILNILDRSNIGNAKVISMALLQSSSMLTVCSTGRRNVEGSRPHRLGLVSGASSSPCSFPHLLTLDIHSSNNLITITFLGYESRPCTLNLEAELTLTPSSFLDLSSLSSVLISGSTPRQQVITQLPISLFIHKVSPGIYLSVAASCWGVVAMCSGFARSYSTMAVVRFLVGCSEAVSSSSRLTDQLRGSST